MSELVYRVSIGTLAAFTSYENDGGEISDDDALRLRWQTLALLDDALASPEVQRLFVDEDRAGESSPSAVPDDVAELDTEEGGDNE